MSDDAAPPQLYLVTPADAGRHGFADQLAACLDAVPVACVRLALAGRDPDQITRTADTLRALCHARDVAIVIDSHQKLAASLGLDGVHLTDGARNVAAARKDLGDDAIVGAYCGASRHDGLTAGERGADYVSFGPVSDQGLGDGSVAEADMFRWWSLMIELPVVAEGGLTDTALTALAPHTDFFALCDEIWAAPDPVARLKDIDRLIRGA